MFPWSKLFEIGRKPMDKEVPDYEARHSRQELMADIHFGSAYFDKEVRLSAI
jgi:hypothetical protein